LFFPEEWRTTKQLASHFSLLATTQLQQKHLDNFLLVEAEAISEESNQAWETERQLQELQTAVYQAVDLPHPVKCNGHDICGLLKHGMLKLKFRVVQLKETCILFEIDIERLVGQNQKALYVKPLEDLGQTSRKF